MPKGIRADLASPAFKKNAHAFYARLREEAPVCRVDLPDGREVWLVTRYDDAAAALKDERLLKNRSLAMTPEQLRKEPWVPESFRPITRNMLDLDPPDHTRLRALVQKAFSPRLVERMRERVEMLTGRLLDAALARGRMDLIGDYALPLPTTIIAEMLGVPAEDRHRFHRWTSALVASNPSGPRMLLALPSAFAFLRYLKRFLSVRRAAPRDDLVSALIEAEEAGDRLDAEELLAMVFLLLVAGHETTVNLIGNGVLALLAHPRERERLAADPALIARAVEELLRYDGPLETATERFAREDLAIAGTAIPRGEMVLAVLASADRDPRQFANPDTLDLGRDPNRHLAFGLGIHYCLGAPLARLEAQVAISSLIARAPRLRLAVPAERLRWRRGLVLRGLAALPVSLA